jgi:hypothetical protein
MFSLVSERSRTPPQAHCPLQWRHLLWTPERAQIISFPLAFKLMQKLFRSAIYWGRFAVGFPLTQSQLVSNFMKHVVNTSTTDPSLR